MPPARVAGSPRFPVSPWPTSTGSPRWQQPLLVALHMALLFFDPYAQLRLVDFVVPFLGAYRPLWLGLGTLAFDVLVVLIASSLLRHRLGVRTFRAVHWAAYGLWPLALAHALGNGTDSARGWFLLVAGGCVVTVAAALAWRLRCRLHRVRRHANIGAPVTVQTPLPQNPLATRRLFAARGAGLSEHQACFGALPARAAETLVPSLEQAGLTGRGGAGFPTGRKFASVTGRKPVVIGNGAEGEPLSSKDAVLMARAPHLVLDGLQLAAEAIGADKVYLYLPTRVARAARSAIDERVAAGLDWRRVTVVEAPDAFVAGEESAVVRRIEGGPALPRDRTVLTSISGVRGRPTLVNNVETLAHIALIARYGHRWFRSVGDEAQPGTMLITVSGARISRSVVEVPTGTPLVDAMAHGGVTHLRDVRAVLIGGYHGTWIPSTAFAGARLSRAGLAHLGASPGAGIVHVLPSDGCGLARTADILAYLADEGARQCGPCRNGLPRLAQLFDEVAYGRIDDDVLDELHRILGAVDGRGSCRHPDGTVRLARSALGTFANDIAQHRAGRCDAALRGTL